jgi:hypothetical protein
MGLIARLLGNPGPIGIAVGDIGAAVTGVAEVFTPNATRQMQLAHAGFAAALGQYGEEFQAGQAGWFDRFVNGLNRLPRPALALGTLGLFVFAMAAPDQFAARMQRLAYVPEPLWWLLGAIVSFYFGARELHHTRINRSPVLAMPTAAATPTKSEPNAALDDWMRGQGGR